MKEIIEEKNAVGGGSYSMITGRLSVISSALSKEKDYEEKEKDYKKLLKEKEELCGENKVLRERLNAAAQPELPPHYEPPDHKPVLVRRHSR